MVPYILNWIQVWRKRGPILNLHVIVLQPVHRDFGPVESGLVLYEFEVSNLSFSLHNDPRLVQHFQVFCGSLATRIVVFCEQKSKLSVAIYRSPDHQALSTTNTIQTYSWLILQTRPVEFQATRTVQIPLFLVCKHNISPVLPFPVVIKHKLHTCLSMAILQMRRFLALLPCVLISNDTSDGLH
ncbi:hypothetical protein FVE85_4992 [Porphyridium purpureum]|uniref:Uncharacterized protein n=1 Tax=Porphyridium purpureum TaxID=35688 RepID=A0A5J4YRG1_PORPP|nr:hypothetical protein FVE85_4992 [Porphyridium purpureum]|eukprot:POR3235..scf236_6